MDAADAVVGADPLGSDRGAPVALGADRIRICCSGASLAGIVSHMRHSDSLAVLPHRVVFAMRGEGGITALPLRLEHPPRALGMLRARSFGRLPAADHFAAHVRQRFAALRDHIRRHEQITVWRRD